MSTAVEAVLLVGALYAAIGVLFAIFFVTRGLSRLDPEAESSTLGFRLLVLPGAIALWPFLLARLSAGSGTGKDREES